MILKREYKLDVVPGGPPLIIRASRFDSSSTLVLSLFARVGRLEIPSGAEAAMRGMGSNPGALSFSASAPVVTVNLTRQMTKAVGMMPFEIVLTADGHTFVTATFYLDVR